MLDSTTKRRIDDCRDILVGKVPDPKSQIDQITVALIYKFMHDMDQGAVELGGKPTFFAKHAYKVVVDGKEEERVADYTKYAWPFLMATGLGGEDRVKLYAEALEMMPENPGLPQLFRDIFKNTYLPYRDPATLREFLKRINEFTYDHSEKLGDAFEYLLSIMGSQGDAGQFRTPRHLIDFMTAVIDPQKHETILDPACGTAGFLISAYKHILRQNSSNHSADDPLAFQLHGVRQEDLTVSAKKYAGDKLTPDDRKKLVKNIVGYDIDPGMVKLALVNLYLHGFPEPHIYEYDTLTSTDRWEERFDVILANPPFMSPKGGIKPHGKFGIPSTRSEVLFVDYIAEHLNPNGRALLVVPEGIIFQSGKAYKALRKKLVDEHYLVGVVSVPGGVFNPYSGVKTSLLWFDRALARKTDKILFVKVVNDGFDLGAQRRPIAQNDLPEAFQLLMDYKWALVDGVEWEVPESAVTCALVDKVRIAAHTDYNLSGDRYSAPISGNQSTILVPLEKVATYVRGVTYGKEDECDHHGKFILRANNIDLMSGSLDLSDLRQVQPSVRTTDDQRLQAGDTLICAASGSADHIGKVAYSAVDTDLFAGGFMAIMRPKEGTNGRYLFCMLRSDQFRMHIASEVVGANIRNLKSSLALSFQIPLPPLPEQEALVAEVEGYQKVVDGARQVVAHYKPRISIDPSWEMVELGEVCDLYQPKTITSNEIMDEGPYKVFGANGVIGYFTEYNHEEPEVLITCRGATCGTINMSEAKSWVTGNAMVAHPKGENLNKLYLRYALIDSNLSSTISGAAQPQITRQSLAPFRIPLPPLSEQDRIVAALEEERGMVEGCRRLVERMESKVRERVARVWGNTE